MASGTDSGSDSSSQDPYVRLSISRDASFEGVQQARDRALAAAGDDPQARARVEAAYDAVLMERLRERQSGRVSSAAATASQREQQVEAAAPIDRGVPGALLTRLRQFSLPSSATQAGSWMPDLSLVEGQGLMVRGSRAGSPRPGGCCLFCGGQRRAGVVDRHHRCVSQPDPPRPAPPCRSRLERAAAQRGAGARCKPAGAGARSHHDRLVQP
jgi:Protein of unknown function (DUF3353).